MKKFLQIVGIGLISQVVTFLSTVVSRFGGTIFGFIEWEEKASKSAIAFGLPVVLVIVAVCFTVSKATLKKFAIDFLIASVVLLCVCAAIYLFLQSGIPLTVQSLYVLRDLVWMWIYVITLVIVSLTIALGMLLLK